MKIKIGFLFLGLMVFVSASAQQKKVILTGTLQMEVLSAFGDHDFVQKWQRTEGDDEFLNFVLYIDNLLDVNKYCDVDKELDPKDYSEVIALSLRSSTLPMNSVFAEKYANRRVLVTGTLSVSLAGWRNSPNVLFEVEEIAVIDPCLECTRSYNFQTEDDPSVNLELVNKCDKDIVVWIERYWNDDVQEDFVVRAYKSAFISGYDNTIRVVKVLSVREPGE